MYVWIFQQKQRVFVRLPFFIKITVRFENYLWTCMHEFSNHIDRNNEFLFAYLSLIKLKFCKRDPRTPSNNSKIMWNISATSMATANHWWFIPFYTYDISIEHGFSAARLWLWQGTFSSVADFLLFANLQLNILVLQRTFLSLLALQLLDNLADYVYVIASWCLILEDDFDLVDIGMNDMQILIQYFLHKALPHGFEFWHVLTVTRVRKQSNTW